MTTSSNDVPPFKTNAVALKLFLHVANEWQLTQVQNRQLFSILSNQQYEAWMTGTLNSENSELLAFVSQLIAIYKQLHQIFPGPAQANAWMSKPNEEYQNRSCLEVITQDGLKGVQSIKKYLENQLI